MNYLASQAILEIGSRHPLRLEQAIGTEDILFQPGTIDKMLKNKELFKVSYNTYKYLLPGHFVIARQ